MNDVLSITPSLPVRSNLAGAPELNRSCRAGRRRCPADPCPTFGSADGDALDRAIRAAAHAMFPGRRGRSDQLS